MKFAVLVMSLVSLLALGDCKNNFKAPKPIKAEPCCTASQFEISSGATIGETLESGTLAFQEYLVGAFDFEDRKYAMNVTVRQFGGATTQYRVIQLFNKNEMYLIMGEECHKLPPSQEPGRCVPDTAYYTGSFYMGNKGLLLDNWFMAGVPGTGFQGEVYSSTTSDDCTPIGVTAVGTMVDPHGNKVELIESGGYFNFTQGIKDPDQWFVPPSSCNNATVMAEDSTWQPMRFWMRMRSTKVHL